MADVILKRCCTCKEFKATENFPKNRSEKDGLKKRCKSCNNAANKDYRKRNPEAAAASSKNWVMRNPEKAEAKRKRWVEKNPGRQHELSVIWREKNPERYRENLRRYSARAEVRLQKTIRERIRQMIIGKKSIKTFDLLGYTFEELRLHIERQFTRGMSWDNFGEWHIDHIVPLSSFRIKSELDKDMQAAWALPNLRPLWAKENLSKSNKILTLL